MNGRKFAISDLQLKGKWSKTALPGILEENGLGPRIPPPFKDPVKTSMDKFTQIDRAICHNVEIQQDEVDNLTASRSKQHAC